MVDINIHVDSHVIEHVEDIHLMLEHMIVKAIKEYKYTESEFVRLLKKTSVNALDV
jgi:hypothetical protein